MKIEETGYPVPHKRKFRVIIGRKIYTCYLDPWNGNYVFTGNGNSESCMNITGTSLGMQIILECQIYAQEDKEKR